MNALELFIKLGLVWRDKGGATEVGFDGKGCDGRGFSQVWGVAAILIKLWESWQCSWWMR